MGYLSCKTEASVVTCRARKDEIEPAKLKMFRYKELEAATGGFAREQLIGKGSYGWVYKGVLRDGTTVAVKRTSSARKVLHLQEDNPLDNELEVLSKIRSPRLVNLVGFSRDNKETLLVVDFMANGTLHDVLHHASPSNSSSSSSSRSNSSKLSKTIKAQQEDGRQVSLVSWQLRMQMALQIAKGLRALHTATPPVIHRDVKSSNILIDSEWNARLGDFGLALRGRIEDVIRLCTPPAGTLGYLDPGYISPAQLSTKTDVFSFGILLLEMMSGRNAIDVQYRPASILEWALPLIRTGRAAVICDPRLTAGGGAAAERVAVIAARCVRACSSRRPSMVEVVRQLRDAVRPRLPAAIRALAPPPPGVRALAPVTPGVRALDGGGASRAADGGAASDGAAGKMISVVLPRGQPLGGRGGGIVRMVYAAEDGHVSTRKTSVKMADYLV